MPSLIVFVSKLGLCQRPIQYGIDPQIYGLGCFSKARDRVTGIRKQRLELQFIYHKDLKKIRLEIQRMTRIGFPNIFA